MEDECLPFMKEKSERGRKTSGVSSHYTVLLFESLVISAKLILVNSQFSQNKTTRSREVAQFQEVLTHFPHPE